MSMQAPTHTHNKAGGIAYRKTVNNQQSYHCNLSEIKSILLLMHDKVMSRTGGEAMGEEGNMRVQLDGELILNPCHKDKGWHR